MSTLRFDPHILSPVMLSLNRPEIAEEPTPAGLAFNYTDRGCGIVRIGNLARDCSVHLFRDASWARMENANLKRMPAWVDVTLPQRAKIWMAITRHDTILSLRLYVNGLKEGEYSLRRQIRHGRLVEANAPDFDRTCRSFRQAFGNLPNLAEIVEAVPTGAIRAVVLRTCRATIEGVEAAPFELDQGDFSDHLNRLWPALLNLVRRSKPSDWPALLNSLPAHRIRFAPRDSNTRR